MTQQLLNKERQTPLTFNRPSLTSACSSVRKFFFDFSTYFWAVIAAENNRRIPTLAPLIKTPKVNGRNDFRTRYVLKQNVHKKSTKHSGNPKCTTPKTWYPVVCQRCSNQRPKNGEARFNQNFSKKTLSSVFQPLIIKVHILMIN